MEPGEALPRVTVPNQEGEPVVFPEAGAEGYTLIYFYPKADTPGCTKQACSLRDAYTALQEAGVTVFGVSYDSPEAQKAFAAKYQLPFTLLADEKGELAEALGVPAREKKGNFFAARQAFLFQDAQLIWLDRKASTEQQAADVLAVLAEED